MSISYPAPAKLNLMLRVIGQRPDGYHELQTVFQFIDLADQLQFSSQPPGHFSRTGGAEGVSEADDLTIRAARLLMESAGIREGVHIHMHKVLPLGGGIGGGSSDAASTLIVLNRLWRTGYSREELMALGKQLGADVPIFIFGRSAWAEGIGEQLTALENLSESHYVLVHPGIAVSTREIFTAPELTRQHPPSTIGAFLGGAMNNTLESTVCTRYPEVEHAIHWLHSQSLRDVRLTGSGACVFGVAEDAESARNIVSQVPPSWRSWAVKGLNQHPLYDPAEH
ncbi:4-(cytidine 5'-diphospho)-2-C-methyl-D-erythritol kinase [Acidithiobacillus montserratensis]|uniref:4-(Cytidine 5'-diphospho)-2-C-methyl-D-erythritol kinase n=1 Tax=Acidithiobacillus montserratensis TaxID=2729135 RepID=A0ACD5HH55_9PROT|nr:4-(cytidine 5'-diphospho)-2-C-methyl-D-erythritol kinase [Acidithiobacillus montserratensis]MBN2678615.1 4-(cytidine 5'-diphospho)-2-C-methyl-D-erythritol kinase [Acidithiobacillaceae bacterium]MBU2747147.1 4-(cytidine 5'-diphospho)-2-C-methyl-D-erythritol kinase [Acidithiobacillus montserratensis]